MAGSTRASLPTVAAGLGLSSLLASGSVRDWASRIGAAGCFFVLAVAMVLRTHAVFLEAGGFDVLKLARLLSSGCLTAFYFFIIWLTLIRGAASKKAPGVQPRISALLGTFLGLGFAFLPTRTDLPAVWYFLSAGLFLCGLVFVLLTIPRLGRSFSVMAEARVLVTRGPYAVIRHPLYLGEEVALIGAFIPVASGPALLLLLAQMGFLMLRIRNEEAVLSRAFPDYAAYAARTARLIPGVW